MPTPQYGQTLSNNLSANCDEFFECVWPFCEIGAEKFNWHFHNPAGLSFARKLIIDMSTTGQPFFQKKISGLKNVAF